MRVAATGTALALVCAVVAACGGSSRLSGSAYRAKLASISKEADKAQSDVEKALHATSVAEIRKRLSNFADAESRLGDEVAKLRPPKNAVSANALLARGEHDLADETRNAVTQLAKLKTPQAALTLLNKGL